MGSWMDPAAANGRYFACVVASHGAFLRGVRVWDGQTGRFLWDHHNGHYARFSADGEQVYILERDPKITPQSRPEKCIICAYRAATGELIRTLCRFPSFTHGFYLSADGQYLSTKNGEVWHVADARLLRKEGPFNSFAGFTPDSKQIFLRHKEVPYCRLFRLPDFEEIKLPEAFAAYEWMEKQPAGLHATAGEAKTAADAWWLLDGDGRKLQRWLPSDYGKVLSRISWINSRESLVLLDDGTIRLFDVFTQEEWRARYRLVPWKRAKRCRSPRTVAISLPPRTRERFCCSACLGRRRANPRRRRSRPIPSRRCTASRGPAAIAFSASM